ncbi:hypothetical protein E4U42_001255 [Claviceps africana]|uniref:C2H2-type domain-containing protein n=1 Tax=Claviceps africana TaxID=83212 RepID=A0A8K0J9N3_9HYPO|nr:hypothetical protein E4U42_001255 [Claviceps africana]
MASSKEMQQSSRPLTLQRPSLSSSPASAIPGRQSHARNNSHSLLSSYLNANHRITRRKSVTAPVPNVAALTAAVSNGDQTGAIPIVNSSRRQPVSRAALARTSLAASLPSPPASLPTHRTVPELKHEHQESAIDDGNDASADEAAKLRMSRSRRASDDQSLLKDGKKSNRIEVRCNECGKSYKHGSCLIKHLWEHTPEWSLTSKLLISKHQQVQLLEAASVLVAMNGKESTASTPPESMKDSASEPDSSSPAASGYSELIDRQSSTDTTPPPTLEEPSFDGLSYRDGNQTDVFKSYQPTVSGSIPNGFGYGHFRQPSHERRPRSSGANRTGEDDRALAAAVELLSCSFNSNNGSHGTLVNHPDAPPMPPVPVQYLDQATSFLSTGFINSFPRRQPESFTRGEVPRGSRDVKMEDSDDDFDLHSRARSDEDDDGVFGRMEE